MHLAALLIMEAFNALCHLLQGRDHSERELRTKLAVRFQPSDIEAALKQARTRGLLLPPVELSQNLARSLHRRNKGFIYIQNKLRQKGLPPVEPEPELELQKARRVLEKLKKLHPHNPAKLSRQLMTRGFEYDTIKQVLDKKA